MHSDRCIYNLFRCSTLDQRNADDSLMAFVCPALPESICSNLLSSFLACFDGNEKVVEKILESPFQCLHFSIWNRYATKGDQAPTDIHPHYMSREDVSQTNHTQTLPYQSRDILEHQQLYDNILLAFGEECLPAEYEVLVELAQDLPGGEVSPVTLFLSLVVNLNVSTLGHCDRFDKDFCLVLPLGNFRGGALVMFEQRLVLELHSGDFAMFHSAETTHFNLQYKGKCASFVLHTDKSFDTWKDTCNGWAPNDHFHRECSSLILPVTSCFSMTF
ncbi:hypothetical protein EV702DRAFT_962506 [Suillus placidus]|uniref:Uncharacterized protein n=1 Tax=Suillus placidus TaxID=48579 RepID=A0A9P7A2W2_9AGAM|nr:hypothetical protein EV702DRAFT_962506 [Suillus placidus]